MTSLIFADYDSSDDDDFDDYDNYDDVYDMNDEFYKYIFIFPKGSSGMKYSLISRDLIADCIETMHRGYSAVCS